MLVLHIDSISRNRQYVSLENGESLLLGLKDIYIFQIQEGREINEEILEQAREQMRRNCLARSGSILQNRDYSRKRLGDKLRGYGYPSGLVDETLDSLQDAGYLDDERLAQTYVRYHLEDRSLRRIRTDLERRGISSDVIDAAVEKVRDEMTGGFDTAEEEQIRRLLQKRHFDAETADWNEKQKAGAYLYRKGYSIQTIERILHGNGSFNELDSH